MVKRLVVLGLWSLAFFISLTGVVFALGVPLLPYVPPQAVPTALNLATAGLPPWVSVAAGVGYMCLEAWLGSTDAVKSGSVLALIVNAAKSVFSALAGKDDGNPKAPLT